MVVDQAVSHFNEERHPHGPTRLDRLCRAAAIGADNTRISAYAIVVTTFEPVDYRALFPSISHFLNEKGVFKSSQDFYGHLDMIFNKAPEQKAPGQPFEALIEIPEVFEEIKTLPDDRNVHSELIKYFDDRAIEVGAEAAEYIDEFDMSRILDVIKNLKTKQKREYAGWENWCMHISKTARLPVKVPVTNRS
jgi:hypothetical protein